MGAKYDFSGWATKNDLVCADAMKAYMHTVHSTSQKPERMLSFLFSMVTFQHCQSMLTNLSRAVLTFCTERSVK